MFILKYKHTYTKPIEIRMNYPESGNIELVSSIPDLPINNTARIDSYLLKRMEYLGNIKTDYKLFRLVFNQNII